MWGCTSVTTIVFKLCNAEEGGIGHLKPTFRLHDTEVVGTLAAGSLLRHTKAYQIQEIIPYGVECCSAVET